MAQSRQRIRSRSYQCCSLCLCSEDRLLQELSVSLAVNCTILANSYSAFEIKDIHHKEPPPKHILEDVTAKGGDLLTRTVQGYHHPTVEEGDASAAEEMTTPTADRMDVDEPGSGAGRSTRGEDYTN